MPVLYKTGRLPQQTMLKGQYLVLDVIGKGGMGAVYLTMDTITRRRVAVKEMGTSFVTPDRLNEIYTRFEQEANILRRLNHPNLPRFYEYFHENGRSYIVMDFIEGKTLAHLLAANSWQPLPVADVISYAKQLCDVLNYLHTYHDEQGRLNPLLFCDLKPANVIVTSQGQVCLVDFGIARFFSDPAHDVMGTLGYSPPEQFYGHTTPRSDLYSLGATLYVCLTGHNPKNNVPTVFTFQPVRNLNQHVPVDMEALLRWLLATQEADRPESAVCVLKTLQDIEHSAADVTTDFASNPNPYGTGIGGIGANFYDDKTARAAQYHAWLIQVNKLPGTLGKLWATYIIPTLSRGYGVVVGFLLKMYGGKVLLDAFSKPVWTPHFWLIFLLSFLFSIGGSAYLINSLHTSPYAVAFFLASVLMVFAFTTGMHKNIKSPLSRNVLLAMSLMPLLLCASLLGLPAVQHTLQTTTLNQLLCVVLIVLGGVTLLRSEERLYWLDHVTLAAIAAVIALQQTRFGSQVWQQLQPQGTLAADRYSQYSTLLIAIPVAIGVLALLKPSRPLGRFSRIFMLVLAVLDLGLQLVLGKSEILPLLQAGTQAFRPSPELLFAVLALGPSVVAFFSVFLPLKPSRLGNGALFVLACSLAYIQNQVGTHISFGSLHSYPLTTTLPKVFSFYQLIAYGLVALAVILFLRLRATFENIDYIVIFGVVVVATVLQSTVWFGHTLAGYRIGNNDAPVTMLLTGLNEAMALGLVLLVVAFLVLTVLTIFFKLSYHAKMASRGFNQQSHSGIERLTSRIFHVMIVSVSVTCVLLLNSFGQQEPILVQPFTAWGVSLTAYDIVQWLLIAIAAVAFIRLFALMSRYNSYGRTERWVMLFAALVCAFLLFGDQGSAYIILTPPSVSPRVLQALPFFPLIYLSALATALLSLLWLRNPWHAGDRGLLLLFLGGACVCALLQLLHPVLLVASLILLIQGLVLATRMEQVR